MKQILIAILLFSNAAIGQEYVLVWANVPKEPNLINYQVQLSTNNVNWTTIATVQPKKSNDTNRYSYTIPIANYFVRIKTLFTNTIIYAPYKQVTNTNVSVTNAIVKIQSSSDNLSWTSSNEVAASYYNIERSINGSSTWELVGKLSKNTSGKYVVNISKSGSNRKYRLTVYYVNGIKSLPISFSQ